MLVGHWEVEYNTILRGQDKRKLKMDNKDIALTLLKDKIAQGKLCKLKIRSHWSMYPLFEQQSALKVRSVLIKDLHLGDIVVYKKGQELIAHRYVRVAKTQSEKAIVTKGDNSASFDRYVVLDEELLGKVVSFAISGKTINCENMFWRSVNAFLAGASLLEANSYSLVVSKLGSKNLLSVCLRKILVFVRRTLEQVRIMLIKLLVLWVRIVF